MVVLEPGMTPDVIRRLKERVYAGLEDLTNPNLLKRIEEPLKLAIKTVERRIHPRTIAQSLPILSSDHESVTTDAGRIKSAMFAFLVDRCSEMRQAVFFVSTIGMELEEMARSRHGLFHQWIFDKIGAELIEIVADDMECGIRERLFNGQMQCSRRISPGYCDWPLDGQRVVFRALDADKIDVKLSNRMVMTPCKSISGVIVAAQTVGVMNPCSQCTERQCRWRTSL